MKRLNRYKKLKGTEKKKEAQKLHVRRRFKERFNLDFNKTVNRHFLSEILSGRAEFLLRKSNRVSYHAVEYNNEVYNVVFDRFRSQVVTVLLPEMKIGGTI